MKINKIARTVCFFLTFITCALAGMYATIIFQEYADAWIWAGLVLSIIATILEQWVVWHLD